MRRLALILVLTIAAAGWYFRHDLAVILTRSIEGATELREIATEELGKIEERVSAPEPLRTTREAPQSFLTAAGTVTATNAERAKENLKPLARNAKLDAAASAKVKDMFVLQYFAHESPTGAGPGELADNAGYEYLAVGENLALGNFSDDADLVAAWMASPGHRANILSVGYTEIGVAVMRGSFEGRTTWLAVQEFGRPRADCPKIDSSLKSRIQASQAELTNLKSELDVLRTAIEVFQPKRGGEYRRTVEKYNESVDTYNTLRGETQSLIDEYNAAVRSVNECIAQ